MAILIPIFGCKEEKRLETVKTSDYDDFVRNPIGMDLDVDSSLAAQITFDETFYDFGEVEEGERVAYNFHFINSGQSPLLISEARSTCGCTVPEWPKEPIEPGERSQIQVVFNTQDRTGYQDKPITIYANTLPGRTVVRLKGNVLQKEE